MHRTIVLFIVALGVLLTACYGRGDTDDIGAPAPVDNIPDIGGSYVVNGFDPMGAEYGGLLEITPSESDNEYALEWIITGSVQSGTGTLEGNKLHVNWQTVEGMGPGAQGQATYTVTEKGILDGTRSILGQDRVGTELAYPNEE